MKVWFLFMVLGVCGLDPMAARAAEPSQLIQPTSLSRQELLDIGFRQRLGAQVPMDLTFTDSTGKPIQLGTLLARKPTVLALVYFDCPNLCTVVLNALVQSLADLRRSAGDGFQVVVVSIDPREKPALAAEKKASYLRLYGRGEPAQREDAWHFLVSGVDPDAVERLAAAIGYRYRFDPQTNQYAHGSGIVILDPAGRVTQYLLGIEFPPLAIDKAVQDAQARRTGSPVADLLLLCYRYNPLTGPYGSVIAVCLKAGGVGMVLALGGFIGLQLYREKRREEGSPS